MSVVDAKAAPPDVVVASPTVATTTTTAEPVDHALSGSVSSMCVFALLYPLDVARTRQQARMGPAVHDNERNSRASGVVAVLSSILEREGIGGLYAGLSANIVSIGVSQALYFFFYEIIKDAVVASSRRGRHGRARAGAARTSLVQDLFIAFVSGIVNATVTCPLWVAATRLKLVSNHRPKSRVLDRNDEEIELRSVGSNKEFRHNHHSDDDEPTFIGSLVEVVRSGDSWKGLGPSLILCSNPALQYGIYEQLKQRMLYAWAKRRPGRVAGEVLNPLPAFIIGAVAKTIATIFTYPLQLIQTRTREEGFQGGMWEAFQALVAESGARISPYFRGMNSKLIMTVLNASLMFMTKEWILRLVLMARGTLGQEAFRFLRWSTFFGIVLYSGGEIAKAGAMKGRNSR